MCKYIWLAHLCRFIQKQNAVHAQRVCVVLQNTGEGGNLDKGNIEEVILVMTSTSQADPTSLRPRTLMR